MPAIFVPIAVFLAFILSGVIARVLATLGLGIATYYGVQALVDELRGAVASAFGDVGADAVAIVALLGIDEAMTIILSAYVAVLTLNGIRNGVRKIIPFAGD
ncbi:DUF2523 domain-containing protein [Ectothiorhodospiraceae bacterium WFHF3C12]|nr:DUF2523 domain-containing protein [Ectothiorhodospiraceae bacterium WFHF3C12]